MRAALDIETLLHPNTGMRRSTRFKLVSMFVFTLLSATGIILFLFINPAPASTTHIVKSSIDYKEYKVMDLNNGLRVLLVSDPYYIFLYIYVVKSLRKLTH